MPSEAEVFLNHLNATHAAATSSSPTPPAQMTMPAQIEYLEDRIKAVKHENRHFRETQEQIHREKESLREQMAKLVHENQQLFDETLRLADELRRTQELVCTLGDELRRTQELAATTDRYLTEIKASWNWILVNRIHRHWHDLTGARKRR